MRHFVAHMIKRQKHLFAVAGITTVAIVLGLIVASPARANPINTLSGLTPGDTIRKSKGSGVVFNDSRPLFVPLACSAVGSGGDLRRAKKKRKRKERGLESF